MQEKFAYIEKKQYFCTGFSRKSKLKVKSNMKKLFVLVALLVATLSGVKAATGITLDADLKAALPSGEFFLPGPPAEGSLIWKDDSAKYFQYKALARENYDDEKQDYWDSAWAKINEQYYFALYRLGADSVMNAPFLTNVSWSKKNGIWSASYTRNETDFPELNLLELMCEQMKEDNTSKLWRTRPRPYCYFGDWYTGKLYKKGTANASSYPSGHGYFAGLFGMCMLYIDPDNSRAIKKMIDEWAECRLLVGAHWNTDVEDGKQLGAIAFAIAMNYPQFKNQVMAAKEELKDYRDKVAHTYTREHPHMNLNTLCYPYQIDTYSGATFYTMLYKEVDGEGNPVNIYLQEHVGALEAGKPYFYVPESESNKLECHFSGEEVAAGNDGNGVYGVYADLTPVTSGMYVTYNNKFTKAGNNVTLHEYRAYVNMDEVSTDPNGPAYIPGRNVIKISNASEVATDIVVGAPTRQAQSAKVLNNGQLVIYNNDRQYNAVGQEIR
jgi:hypothetical protein